MRLGVAILALAILAFGPIDRASSQTVLRVGLSGPDYFGNAPLLAAQELGLFKKAGLQVEITAYRGSGAAQEALAAGAADIIDVAPIGAAIAVDKGVKQKIIANNLFNRPAGFKLLVAANSSINTLRDLDGKKIGITSRGSGTDLYASLIRKQAGINAQLIPVGAGLVASLQAGNVDAVPMWATGSYRALLNKDARELHDLGSMKEAVIPDLWVASDALIAKNPGAVRDFLRGLMGGTRQMKVDRAFGLKIVKQWTKEDDDRAVALAYDDLVKYGDLTGNLTREAYESSLAVAAEAGLATAPDSYTRAVTTAFFPVTLD